MSALRSIAAGLVLGGAAWFALRIAELQAAARVLAPATPTVPGGGADRYVPIPGIILPPAPAPRAERHDSGGIFDVFGASFMRNTTPSGWQQPTPWDADFAAAEARHALPPGLLKRVAWQESRFRPDIVSGKTVSGAGALGIMQIVPRWHPGVDPLDPHAAIDYAGGYLRRLYDQFGDWTDAIAAYNWGPGNLRRKGLVQAPSETVAYVNEIGADVALV